MNDSREMLAIRVGDILLSNAVQRQEDLKQKVKDLIGHFESCSDCMDCLQESNPALADWVVEELAR